MTSAIDFYIKEGDRAPLLEVTCVDENSEVVPLTAAVGAKFSMIDPGDDTPKVDSAVANIVDIPGGKIQYLWDADDTDTPGNYDGEFEVEWSDGNKTTFPNFRFLRIKVTRSIDTTD